MSLKESPTEPMGEKDVGYGEAKVLTTRRRSSAINPEVLQGELFDARYETTQRGLKSRYINSYISPGQWLTSFYLDTRK